MTFPELIADIKKLNLEETRTNTNHFFEFVIRTELANELNAALERYFGPPLKAAGEQPSKEASQTVASFGGIRKDQILYCVDHDKFLDCAMLWPWASGSLLTVKVIQNHRKK